MSCLHASSTRQTIISAALVLALASTGAWHAWILGDDEPDYEGRPLSTWLDDRYPARQGPVGLADEAVKAVRAIGPSAIPTLMSWIEARRALESIKVKEDRERMLAEAEAAAKIKVDGGAQP